jgi:uncharacterized membrane protein
MWWIVIAVAVALVALYKSPIRLFLQSPLNYLVAPAVLLLALAWNLRAHLPSAATEGWIDLSFHFFGSSLLVAMFGLWPALVILFLVSLAGIYALTGNAVEAATHYLFVGILPAIVASLVIDMIRRFMPKHLFILILGNGYMAAFSGTFVCGMLIYALQQFLGLQSLSTIDPVGWIMALIILSFSEGSMSGMLLAIFLIYRPAWVPTYDESFYLDQKNPRSS